MIVFGLILDPDDDVADEPCEEPCDKPSIVIIVVFLIIVIIIIISNWVLINSMYIQTILMHQGWSTTSVMVLTWVRDSLTAKTLRWKLCKHIIFSSSCYWGYCNYCNIFQVKLSVNALLETFELTDSAQRKGHFAHTTVWCLATPSTVVCSAFTTRPLQNDFTGGSRWLDHFMIRPPGIDI